MKGALSFFLYMAIGLTLDLLVEYTHGVGALFSSGLFAGVPALCMMITKQDDWKKPWMYLMIVGGILLGYGAFLIDYHFIIPRM